VDFMMVFVVVFVFFSSLSILVYCIIRFDDNESSWYQCNNYCLVFQFSYMNGPIWVNGSQLSIIFLLIFLFQVSVKDDFICPKRFSPRRCH
jgi:hypothetical protein